MSAKSGPTQEPSLTQPWMDANFVQISIGRNVGENPMDSFDWALFQTTIRPVINLLRGTRTQVIEVDGKGGEWLGIPEETHVFMIINPLIKDQFIVDHIRECLRGIAQEFGQDAIALVFGTSTLVER